MTAYPPALAAYEAEAAAFAAAASADALAKLAPSFYFVPREALLSSKEKTLPRWQALQKRGTLVKLKVDIADAFRNGVEDKLFVSHRWEEPTQPDTHGEQLRVMREHLTANPAITHVWYDYYCMPQKDEEGYDDRTPTEKTEFDFMLQSIADLYLTTKVLIILDVSYISRFW